MNPIHHKDVAYGLDEGVASPPFVPGARHRDGLWDSTNMYLCLVPAFTNTFSMPREFWSCELVCFPQLHVSTLSFGVFGLCLVWFGFLCRAIRMAKIIASVQTQRDE